MKEKQTGYAIATLILMVPCMLANIWFMKEIWNIGLVPIFTQLPELTFKTSAILYLLIFSFITEFKYEIFEISSYSMSDFIVLFISFLNFS